MPSPFLPFSSVFTSLHGAQRGAGGSNSYRLVGVDGVEEALVYAEHLKPYVDDVDEDEAEPQPPEG